MKVLHVISAPAAGGAEIYVKDLAKEMSKSGVTVFIAFLGCAKDIGRDPVFEKQFLSELEENNIEYYFIGNVARKNPLWGAYRIRKLVKNKRIDVYHAHLKYGVLFGVFLSVPRVYTHHNIIMDAGAWWAFVSNRLVDAYVGISNICSNEMESFFSRNICIIFNGIDIQRLGSFVFKRTLIGNKFKFISVGGILPQKNYNLLVDSVALLPDHLRNRCTFNIAGEGPTDKIDSLNDYIKTKGMGNNIYLLGNRSDIPDLLGDSDVFIMSSIYEGLPISLIEATVSGLPCIVTDVGGCSEVIDYCQNGLVVYPKSPRHLADAIEQIVSDKIGYAAFSQNAIKYSGNFYIQIAVEKHLELYRSLLKRSLD